MAKEALLPNILLIWAGMIFGISCLEAWVKFKTPHLSKATGLQVGRTVFNAFHLAQWALLTLLFLVMILTPSSAHYLVILLSLSILLCLQTRWLFPRLCKDVEIIAAKHIPPRNSCHLLYAFIEMSKLLVLLGGGFYREFLL